MLGKLVGAGTSGGGSLGVSITSVHSDPGMVAGDGI